MNNPFSDEILVNKLHSQGISLARRTVAKYRELQISLFRQLEEE